MTGLLDVFRESWHFQWDDIARLLIAVVLGGAIGFERELRDKPAGFRTIILICVGACVFTMLSQSMGGPDLNSTRIAAQIVTGIGFLGAGAILRNRNSVFGLTTAATIWAVAAIGMAVGFGEFALSVMGTVAILVALFIFDFVEKWVGIHRDIQIYDFVAPNTDDVIQQVDAMFKKASLQARKRTCYQDGDDLVFHVRAMGAKANHEKLRLSLARSDDHNLRRS